MTTQHYPRLKGSHRVWAWIEPDFSSNRKLPLGVMTDHYSSLVKPQDFRPSENAYQNILACELDLEVIPKEPPLPPRNRITTREKVNVARESNLEVKDDAKRARERRLTSRPSGCMVGVLFVLFVLSSGSIIMTTLLYFGKIPETPTCSCNDYPSFEVSPGYDAVYSKVASRLTANFTPKFFYFQVALNSTRQRIDEMWKSVSATREDLEKEVWNALNGTERKLLLHLESVSHDIRCAKGDIRFLRGATRNLTAKVNAISKMPGPIGLPGYNGSQGLNGSQGPAGPPGPKGAGNFSQCLHKFAESTPIVSGGIVKAEVSVPEPNDRRIVGATCSTDDAKEYRLSSEILQSGKRSYTCKCAGQSTLMKGDAGHMKCFMHYWECPLA